MAYSTEDKEVIKLRTVKKLHRDINKKMFRGVLSTPVIRLTRSKRNHGKYVFGGNDKPVLWIAKKQNYKEMLNCLVHEMIHQFQDEIGHAKEWKNWTEEMSHGATFLSWAEKFYIVTGQVLTP